MELTCKLTRISEPLDLSINPSSLTVDALALAHNLPDRADPWQIVDIRVLAKLQDLLLQLLGALERIRDSRQVLGQVLIFILNLLLKVRRVDNWQDVSARSEA